MADQLPSGFSPVQAEEAPSPNTASVPTSFTPDTPSLQETTTSEVDKTEETSPTFMERLEERMQGRIQEVNQTLYDLLQDERAPWEGGLSPENAVIQLVGKGIAGPAIDIVGEVTSTVLGKAWEASKYLAAIIPPVWRDDIKDAATGAYNYVMESPAATEALLYASNGLESYQGWKERNPQDAKTLESVVNIAAFWTPAKQRSPVADFIERSAHKSRRPFVSDLVSAPDTFKNRSEQVTRTTQTLFGTKKVIPTVREEEIIDEVAKLGVSSTKSYQLNYNVIKEANLKAAKALEDSLERSGATINVQDVVTRLDQAVTNLTQTSTFLTGDAALVADRAKAKALEIFSNTNGTAADLLRARRSFDRWVAEQKGGGVFDPVRTNALTETIRTVRNELNDIVADAVPEVAVKDSLRRQSLLYSAMDNVQYKAAFENATLFGRALQNMHRATGLSLPRTPLYLAGTFASGVGLLSQGWFPYMALPMMAVPAAYATFKGLTSPALRVQTAKLIRAMSGAIDSTANPAMRTQLRTDRAALIEMLKMLPEDKESSVDEQTPADDRLPQMLENLERSKQ